VTGKNPDNPKSIERLSIYYKAMREAENTAERLEGQLGLTPGKRGRVGKVTKNGSARPVPTRSSARRLSRADPATAWAQAAVRGDFVVGELVRMRPSGT
jgi:hypothetical protein